MITEFSVNVDESQKLVKVNVHGEIDIYTCGDLRKVLTETTDKGNNSFILNLTNIQYIDSTGLGSIAHTAQKIQQQDGHIYVICTKPQINKIFEVSGLLSKNISLYETEKSILDNIGEQN